LNEVPEQRGHTGEGERRDGQELSQAEEEVAVVVPHAAEDVRLVDHADVDEVLEEEWARRGEVLEEKWTCRGGRCGTERDEGAGRSGAGRLIR
jgi:hypothetical protein